MSELLLPRDHKDLSDIITSASDDKTRLEVIGENSKQYIGRPMRVDRTLTTRQLSGINFYSPEELVISVRAGTSLSMVEHTLRHEEQQLAFEPIDYGHLFGFKTGQGTIGSVVACNLSGPRRIRSGAARDSLLGIHGVNGRGEYFQNGGRVMKNVTGYDLTKGLTGSWGTLCVFSEVILKVIPRFETSVTLVLQGLDDRLAINALCDAMKSPYEVTGAVHLQKAPVALLTDPKIASLGTSLTAIRLENFETAVRYRSTRLRTQLSCYGDVLEFSEQQTNSFWQDMQHLKFLTQSRAPVWRISTPPQNGPILVSEIERVVPVSAIYDWSGGLIWLEVPATSDVSASDIRRSLAHLGGHATLIRADREVRTRTEVFHPIPGAIGKITRGIKNSFDPHHILNPERMYAGL
ncbi:MAG: FAD-binding protein [bacterium]|nr:FAD-binding protein [bacterium]